LLKRVTYIIRKDLLIDTRDRYSFLAAILYLVTITFVIFKIFGDLSGPTRIGIFWVLLLFTSINIFADSFGTASNRRILSQYQLYNPTEVLGAKLILNFVKLAIAAIILVLLFRVFSNESLVDPVLFGKTVALAILGITATITLTSTLTVYAKNQNALLSILSIPLLIPILLIAMKVSLVSERMFFDTAISSNLLMLFGIDIILLVMGLIFISITWKA